MKKILITFILTFAFLYSLAPVLAATKTTPTPTGTNPTIDLEKQLNDLKDRIASRVAQLNLVDKKGIIGTVSDISDSQISVTDENGNINLIDVDELTKFSSPNQKSNFGISDISKGDTLGILGLYNKESRRILARFVDVMNLPQIISGAVSDINRSDYSFIVDNNENKEYTIEVETVTKTYAYSNPNDGLVKSGFSKMQQGERVIIVGNFDAKDKSKIIAERVLRFPDLPINPKISIAPTPTPSSAPKTQSKSNSTSKWK